MQCVQEVMYAGSRTMQRTEGAGKHDLSEPDSGCSSVVQLSTTWDESNCARKLFVSNLLPLSRHDSSPPHFIGPPTLSQQGAEPFRSTGRTDQGFA